MTTRAPELGSAARSASRPAAARRWAWAAAIAAVIAVLYFVYWRLSWTVQANSDSASTARQAWDMLHGNTLLHGWFVSDVSFYTTEMLQYAVLEAIFGLGTGVVHIAAAMTYTLIVVLAALLAKGKADGAEGLARAVLAGLLVAAPQLGNLAGAPTVSGAQIVLLGPDHTGTVVPVLLTWLVIDRAPRRWFTPVLVFLMLTWIMIADSIVLFTGIAPLVIAGFVRAVPAIWVSRYRARARYELALAVAAGAAAGAGALWPRLVSKLDGYQVWRFQTHTMPLGKLPHDTWNMIQGIMELFGADFVGAPSGFELVLIWVRLAGVLLALTGFGIALARYFREDGILVPGMATAIAVLLAAFLASVHSSNLYSVREIVAVAPLGAVLAGRTLAAPLLRVCRTGPARLWVLPAVAVIAAGYLTAMVYDASRPAAPSENQDLAEWLTQQHLTAGLAGYWEAGSITLDTGGRIQVSAIVAGNGGVGPYYWESSKAEYDPARYNATFVISGGPAAVGPVPVGLKRAAANTFGPPAHVYHYHGYTILVWNKNLLDMFAHRASR